jgi:hypothetical protein
MLGHSVTKCGQLQIHSVYGMNKKDRLTLTIGIAAVIILSVSASTAFAGGPRFDWDEKFDSIPVGSMDTPNTFIWGGITPQ